MKRLGEQLGRIFEVLARSKTAEILLALEERKLKFRDIVQLAGNATTAMRRTKDLQDAGLIDRRVLQDRQRSVEYFLTKRGKELIPLVREILKLEKK